MNDRESPFASAVSQFKPKAGGKRGPTAKQIDDTSTFPTREPVADPSTNNAMTAIGIRYHPDVIERFKALCRGDRRSYGDMLERMMNAYEGKPNPD